MKLTAEGSLSPRSLFKEWYPLIAPELEGFLAIIMNMGLIEVPCLQDYWSRTWPSHVPFFSSVMSRERFNLIFWLLHLSHTKGAQPQRIHKVKAFLDLLLANFQVSYNPSREISVDETIVGFRAPRPPKPIIIINSSLLSTSAAKRCRGDGVSYSRRPHNSTTASRRILEQALQDHLQRAV